MITHDTEYHRKLITSEYRGAPRFNEMVRKMASYGRELDISILKMVDMFDVDVAEADQLDVLGACVGVSRSLKFEPSPTARGEIICPTPFELSQDIGAESKYTIYKTPVPSKLAGTNIIQDFTPADMDDMPLVTDDVYRIMIKARIIQNVWKGNVLDLYEMWDNLFPDNQGLQIQDLQDMSFNIVLLGNYSKMIQELIVHGYIIPKPEGVRINTLSFIDTDGLPIFAYDYNNINYSGYKSHWLQVHEGG